MALPDQQNKVAVPLAKLKQYFDRIRLNYTERSSGNATIIKVQSKQEKDHTRTDLHQTDEQKVHRF